MLPQNLLASSSVDCLTGYRPVRPRHVLCSLTQLFSLHHLRSPSLLLHHFWLAEKTRIKDTETKSYEAASLIVKTELERSWNPDKHPVSSSCGSLLNVYIYIYIYPPLSQLSLVKDQSWRSSLKPEWCRKASELTDKTGKPVYIGAKQIWQSSHHLLEPNTRGARVGTR